MRPVGALLVLAALAASVGAGAEEVRLGVRSTAEYSNHVVGDESGLALLFQPETEVLDREGRLQWSLSYDPSYELFPEFSGANGWNHDVRGRLTWDLSRRTRLTLSERFRSLNSERLFNQQEIATGGETVSTAEGAAERFTDNRLHVELAHSLSRRDSVALSLRSQIRDRGIDDDQTAGGTSDTVGTTLSARYNRRLSPRTSIGGGLSATRSEVDQGLDSDDETDFFNLFGSVQHRFDETLEVAVSGGPTLIDSADSERSLRPIVTEAFPVLDGEHVDATSCPFTEGGLPFLSFRCDTTGVDRLVSAQTVASPIGELSSGSDSTVSFFANASITKSWDDWSASLRYRRSESTSGQFGSSTIADVVGAVVAWNPTPRWSLRLRGQWSQRSQGTERDRPVLVVSPAGAGNRFGLPPESAVVTGISTTRSESDLESRLLSARLGIRYELTRRIDLLGNAFFSQQSGDLQAADDQDDRLRFSIGIRYRLDPLRF